MFALFGLFVGAMAALLLRPSVPQEQTRYVALAVIAAIDASFGGIRSYLDQTFNDRIFVMSFVTNAALAVGLLWIGDRLDVDLATAVAVVLGVRIFQNMAAIRRKVLGG